MTKTTLAFDFTLEYKLKLPNSVIRTFFIKNSENISENSIILLNFPPFIKKSSLKSILSDHFGTINKILLIEERNLDFTENSEFKPFTSFDQNNLIKFSKTPEPTSKSGIFKKSLEPDQVEQLENYGSAKVFFQNVKSFEKIQNFKKSLIFECSELTEKISISKISLELENECDEYLDWYDNALLDFKSLGQAHGANQQGEKNAGKDVGADGKDVGINGKDVGADGKDVSADGKDVGPTKPDDDWILVGNTDGKVITQIQQTQEIIKLTKKRKKDLQPDFYNFQKNNIKRSKKDLIKIAFEKKRKEISENRKNRQFKPF